MVIASCSASRSLDRRAADRRVLLSRGYRSTEWGLPESWLGGDLPLVVWLQASIVHQGSEDRCPKGKNTG